MDLAKLARCGSRPRSGRQWPISVGQIMYNVEIVADRASKGLERMSYVAGTVHLAESAMSIWLREHALRLPS